jgi:NTE family protein
MLKRLIVFTLSLIYLSAANAQSVGLVLSGGGAKGIAHIEIIRALEKNGIPIDYIAGTSIGAIVGGLYAAGYSPDEMEHLFRSDDFYFWSTGRIQKEYRYYFMRSEPEPSWLELRIEKKHDKLALLPPTNIIPEEQMNFAFMELFAPANAACSYQFDSLMVPFFCVATDVYSNQPVVLQKGDLGAAIRASMTFPLYFMPIEIDGKLLFDGGMVNNFPQDLMEKIFDPDIIIGHKVAGSLQAPSSDNVVEQITSMLMRPTAYEISPEKGILLETDLSTIGLLDFQKYHFIAGEGEKTAEKMIDSIKTRITRRIDPEKVTKKRNEFKTKKPELYFQNIQVEGIPDPLQRKLIIQSIKHKFNIISLNSLKTDYFKLIADQHLKSIRPVAYYNPESGYYDLHLKVTPEKKLRVNIGGNISTKPINQGFGSLHYRSYKGRAYTLNSNIYFGRFYSSFLAGGRVDFPSSLPYYVSGYSTFNRWDFFSSSTELFFEDVRPPYIIQNEYNLRLEAGIPLGLHSKLFTGVTFANSNDQYYQTDIFNKEDLPDKTSFSAFVSQVGIDNNSLNYKQFSTEGASYSLNIKYISGKETNKPGTTSSSRYKSVQNHNYFLIRGNAVRHNRISRTFTLGTQAEVVFSNKGLFKNYRSTKLTAPSYNPTPHSQSLFIENFRSNNFLAAGIKAIVNFNQSLHFRLETHGFVPIKEELPNEDFTAFKSEDFFTSYYLQGLAALVYNTGAGPASIMVNYYEKPNTRFYLTLNFGYIIFNKRGY